MDKLCHAAISIMDSLLDCSDADTHSSRIAKAAHTEEQLTVMSGWAIS